MRQLMSPLGPSRRFTAKQRFGRFSNRPFEVKHFQTVHPHGIGVTRGHVLLSGIGT